MLRFTTLPLSVLLTLSLSVAVAQDAAVPEFNSRLQPSPQIEDRRYPQLPFTGKGDLFDIPPGFERPIEVDEGELIPIRRFVLSGISSEPALAPFAVQIVAILQKERANAHRRNANRLAGGGGDSDGDDDFDDFDDEEDGAGGEFDGSDSEFDGADDGAFADDDGASADSDSDSDVTDAGGDADADADADATSGTTDDADSTANTDDADSTAGDADGASTDGQPLVTVIPSEVGMTIGQMQQAANLAAAFLREQGFFLVQAVIPEQTVVAGEVNILFLPGNLGNVRVENNRWYSDEQITDLFEDNIGKPVYRRGLERGILGMQAMPGLKSYATLVRGSAVGETDLLIRTQDEDRHDFAWSLNNNNLSETGSYQTQLDYSLNNLLGVSDVVSLSVRTSLFPFNNQFFSLAYDLPLSHTSSFYFNFYTVQYRIAADLGFEEITGSTQNLTTRYQWQMLRSRYFNLFFSGVFDVIDLGSRAGDGAIDRSSRLSTLSLSISGDWIETRGSSLNTFEINYSLGLPGILGADDTLPDNDPALLNRLRGDAEYSFLQFTYQRLQSINNNNSILFKLNYHLTGDSLYSVHNASIGGADTLRSLPSSSLLRDKAFLATVEYILSPFSSRRFNDALTWGQVLQFSLFVDHAIAERNLGETVISTPEDPNSVSLTGVGLSAQFNIPDVVKVRIDYGILVRNKATPGNQTSDTRFVSEYVYGNSVDSQTTSQVFFEIAYYF
ncbi:MAG: hypothetical protein K8963_07770 [Proteobacteria bacterium]|nr:hypothetical protein [Pseudomonadota bacterium]